MTLNTRLATVVEAARSKKALHIRIVDVKDIASFTDTFAFMSGTNDRPSRSSGAFTPSNSSSVGRRSTLETMFL